MVRTEPSGAINYHPRKGAKLTKRGPIYFRDSSPNRDI
jgi:Mn-dependent DtxR family transcriptional regulator